MLNNQYFLLITLLPTYLDTSTLKRDNYEVTIYFIWTNLLKQKKWSLSAPSGGQIKSITQVYEYYANPYKIKLFLIFTFNYITTIFNNLGT